MQNNLSNGDEVLIQKNFELNSEKVVNRDFPQVDHFGIDARIVLEQINSAKQKLPLTGLEPLTLGL